MSVASVAVVGTGYVGLCTGLVFAEHGHKVTFVDVDPAKVAQVQAGQAPFHEPGLPELLAKHRAAIAATTDLPAAVAGADLVFLCVGTPSAPDGSIDLAFIRAASQQVGRALPPTAAPKTVVVKSTVVPGTARDVVTRELEAASGRKEGTGFHVASNPEFLREGSAVRDALNPDRIVVGGTPEAARRVLALYERFSCPKVCVDATTAEMVKYSANAFLATKIAFANEMANLSQRLGIDWVEVVRGFADDPRIGGQFFRAGLGFGGSCFPKDVKALSAVAKARHAPSGLLEAVLRNNETQAGEAVRLLREGLGPLRGKRIALLGLAFKNDTDDVRESRSLVAWRLLRDEGAEVVGHDPAAGPNFQRLVPEARLAPTLEACLQGCDGVLVATEWSAFAALSKRPDLLRGKVVVDGRRVLDAKALAQAGVQVRAIGLGQAGP